MSANPRFLWALFFLFVAVLGGQFLHTNREGNEEEPPVAQPIAAPFASAQEALRRPPSEEGLPSFLRTDFLSTSLSALEGHGADLSLPMRSQHRVRCESKEEAAALSAWASENAFDTDEPVVFLGHGGVEFFDVTLIRTEVPHIAEIQKQGALIREGVSQITGTDYRTWVGEIVKQAL